MMTEEKLKIWLNRVIKATEMVALPYNMQITLFPEDFPLADEIALNFCDEVESQADYFLENNLLTNFQYQKIKELSKKFELMGKDKNYWTRDALKNLDEWESCRNIAAEVLEGFNN